VDDKNSEMVVEEEEGGNGAGGGGDADVSGRADAADVGDDTAMAVPSGASAAGRVSTVAADGRKRLGPTEVELR
jgi:hypothetical protein